MRSEKIFPFFGWFLVFLFCFSVRSNFAIDREQIRIVFDNENRTTTIPAFRKGDELYIPLEKLAGLLNIRYFLNPKNKKIVLRVGTKTVKLTAQNPFIVVDDDVYQMALPSLETEEGICVPIAVFIGSTSGLFSEELRFDYDSEKLHINRHYINITGVEIEEKINGTILRFPTTKNFQVADISTAFNRGWLNVTFMGGKLDTNHIASDFQSGIVQQIDAFQFDESSQISFKINEEITDKKVYTNPGEVLISLRSGKKSNSSVINSVDIDRKQWLIDKIIIDPGHGGKHPGASGKKGTQEKTVVLDIAKRLKKLLQDRLNVEVLMTRENDTFVGLKERTQFANANDGKLFISIHANGNKSGSVRGYSTWVLGQGKTQQALEVAEKENSVIDFEESATVYEEYKNAAHILNAIAQSSYLKESLDLANIVNQSLKKKTQIPQWGKGVYQAGFYVLIGAAMPSILVETAFITNTYEERLLKTRTFQQKIAEALFESVKKFKTKYEKEIG